MANKVKKALAAIIATTTMATGIGCITVNANGSLNRTESGSNHLIDVTYSYNVDGNNIVVGSSGLHQGRETMYGFMINKAGVYYCTFGGANNAGCTFQIYKVGNSTPSATINIPQSSYGMPSLSTTVSLSAGNYYTKAVSTSYSKYSSGSVTIQDVYEVY